MLNPYDTSLLGSTRTWYSRTAPPKSETSTTFGTDLNSLSSVQSSMARSSIRSYLGFVLRRVYQYIWPTALQSVPICDCTPEGKFTCVSRSRTFWRFQSLTELSSKIMITYDRPKIDSERRNERWGIPFIWISTGIVTCCSTSSADRPGH